MYGRGSPRSSALYFTSGWPCWFMMTYSYWYVTSHRSGGSATVAGQGGSLVATDNVETSNSAICISRLSSDPTFSNFFFGLILFFLLFLQESFSYFFVLVSCVLFQNSVNYCLKCVHYLYDCKGQYFSMIS